MRKLLVLFVVILLPTLGVAKKSYVNAAIKINLQQNIILGMVEVDGKQKLFNFPLDKADYNDGHTFVIYKKNGCLNCPRAMGFACILITLKTLWSSQRTTAQRRHTRACSISLKTLQTG